MKAKRFAAIVLLVLLTAVLLAGCGGGAAGKYVIKSMNGKTMEDLFREEAEASEEEMTVEDFLKFFEIESLEEYLTLELKEDGTAVSKAAMDDEADTGTWKQEGNKITITIDNEPVEFTLNGRELSATMDGVKYVFVKK